jgi:crotonobetainyl-CoA:carnitine CoA-transferase CaiB-like acyl-CoA transferase
LRDAAGDARGRGHQTRAARRGLVARAQDAVRRPYRDVGPLQPRETQLGLDLKAPAAHEIASSLAARADILIEGFRLGVAARLGHGYDELRARNPRLLYLSVSGFGQEGPYAALPCADSVAQAFSGLMSINLGNDGTPHRVEAIIVDTLTGLYAAQALGVALYARERRGEGRRIEVSLSQCAAAILGHKLAEYVLEGGAPRPLNVPTGAYRTRDGWIMVALVREEQFVRLTGALDRPDLVDDPRFADFGARAAHAPVLVDIVSRIIASGTTEGWLARLRATDILADRVNGFDDWLADRHIVATSGAVCVDQPRWGNSRHREHRGFRSRSMLRCRPPRASASMEPPFSPKSASNPAAIASLCAEKILHIPKAS